MTGQDLQSLARAAAAAPTDPEAVSRLVRALQSIPAGPHEQALSATAATLAESDATCRLLKELAGSAADATRLLGLELAARLPATPGLTPPWRQLLTDHTLPLGHQFAAVISQLQRIGSNSSAAVELLYAFVRGLDRAEAVERLLALQNRLGKTAALLEVRQRLGTPLGPRCPKCGAEGTGKAMARHLWEEHRLSLDGDLVRDPWVMLEDWVADAGNNPDLLARCFEMAMTLDAQQGLTRLEQIMRIHGLESPPALVRKAGEPKLLSVCPRCGAATVPPVMLPARPLHLAPGLVALAGYRVEICQTGWMSRLEVTTPSFVVYHGPEPGRVFTQRGATFLLAGLPVLLAMALAILHPAPAIPVALCLMAAGLGYCFAFVGWRLQEPALDRAVNHAWPVFAGRLQGSAGIRMEDCEFLAGLAQVSVGHGKAAVRNRALDRVIECTESELRTHLQAVDYLVLLWRLAIEDSAHLGRDPVAVAARLLLRCLEGQLPLCLADRLFADWNSGLWTPGNRALLRIQLCDLAFADGMNVAQLREAGRLAPMLGGLLGEHELLRDWYRLWNLRLARPWEHCGDALTVFDLAGQAGLAAHLASCPDLLLYQFVPVGDLAARGETLFLCGRGVVVGQTVYRQWPLRVDAQHAAISEVIERWLYFFLRDWTDQPTEPVAEEVASWKERLQLPESRTCHGCGQRFLARAGETGIAVDDPTPT